MVTADDVAKKRSDLVMAKEKLLADLNAHIGAIEVCDWVLSEQADLTIVPDGGVTGDI